MKVSMFGLGYVGCVGMGCLAKLGHKVIGVDISKDKVALINAGKSTIVEKDVEELITEGRKAGLIEATLDSKYAVLNSEVSFICVGTPNDEKGYLDMSHIYRVADKIAEALKEKNSFHVIAVRSTVMPGTNKKISEIIKSKSGKQYHKDFAIVSNPEFLREGSAVYDFFNPPYMVCASDNQKAKELINKVYKGINSEIIEIDIEVGEIIKFVNNTFHALKVTFANEIGRICKKLNINSHKVMELFCKDKLLNISSAYFKPGFAYGGSCLPKDLKALSSLAQDLRAETSIISHISESNRLHIENAIKLIKNKGRKRIGFIGISFKSGTDDLRFSPSLELVEFFIGKGYEVSIFDPNVHLSRLTGKNKEYLLDKFPHISDILVDTIDELLEKTEIIVVATKVEEFIDLYKNDKDQLKEKIIVDLIMIDQNLLKRENYEGICW